MSIPKLLSSGELPPGIHIATLEEVEHIFGDINERRRYLMDGLKRVVNIFKSAKVPRIFINGSFTTSKEVPKDIDGCWSAEGVDIALLDRRFWDFKDVLDFEIKRREIREDFGIDFFIAECIEGLSGRPFPEFFQTNRNGEQKGIIQINL